MTKIDLGNKIHKAVDVILKEYLEVSGEYVSAIRFDFVLRLLLNSSRWKYL